MIMAQLSYLFAIFNAHLVAAGPHQVPDFWQWEDLLGNAGIHQDTVQELKHSEITDFSSDYPRAGVFVHHNDFNFHRTMN